MKKLIASILSLTLALSLFGCAKQTAQSGNGKEAEENKTEQTDQKTENSEPVKTAAWRYVLTTETRTEEEKNDAGAVLATTSYELPTLAVVCDDASQEPPEVQRRVCEAFNKRVAEFSQGLKSAKQLAEGAFVELADLSDRPEELTRMIANEIIDAIGKENDPDGYFEDYAETIRAKDRFEVSFGADAMNVGFEQYEIAPYAAGMPSFSISYEKLAPFLNERGQRLLSEVAAS